MVVLDSIRGADVLSIDTHGGYRLTLSAGVLTVGTAFLLVVNGRSQNPDPRSPDLTDEAVDTLRHATVQRAMATVAGRLTVEFSGGQTAYISPHPDVEAWRLVTPHGTVSSPPGGGLLTAQ